jgi:copper oxidase (laccase) domain-containing protein
VAGVHAGWRGTATGVAARAVQALFRRGTDSLDLVAAIGPGIGPCCYEVAGLRPDAIHHAPDCTRCGADLYHSYRRDGKAAGRMISFAGFAGTVAAPVR